MKNKRELQFQYTEFSEWEDLDILDKELCDFALEASEKAYADYSRFSVGTAVRMQDNKIITGSNQENAAYPSGMCAERVALFYLKSQNPTAIIKTIAVVSVSEDSELSDISAPCGACRQVMAEYQMQQAEVPIRIILFNISGKGYIIDDVRSLMPFVFYEKRLKRI